MRELFEAEQLAIATLFGKKNFYRPDYDETMLSFSLVVLANFIADFLLLLFVTLHS